MSSVLVHVLHHHSLSGCQSYSRNSPRLLSYAIFMIFQKLTLPVCSGSESCQDGLIEVLKVTDSQTLLRFRTSEPVEPQSHLEVWGYNLITKSVGVHQFLESLKPAQLPDPTNVRQWLGNDQLLGYHSTDGTIHPFFGSIPGHPQSCTVRRKFPRYRAVTVSSNGQVLVALEPQPCSQISSQSQTSASHCLELWPSFDSFIEFQYRDVSTFQPRIIPLQNLKPQQTEIKLASGAGHFLILTHTPLNYCSSKETPYQSTLYAFGDNRFGQLGLGFLSPAIDEPTLVEDLFNLSKIACGFFHSVLIGKEGELYAFGHNRFGQCGVGTKECDLTRPVLVDIGGNGEAGDVVDVLDACCGSEHTVLLTSRGVWVAGSNAFGQLGLKTLEPSFEFQLNDAIRFVLSKTKCLGNWKIQAGRWNTMIWES
ncbi:hypothetical protein O181_007531 [Austropuccinia psidii MF-1]|uniref:Uncharacterized protein n=1 Tax=Austropuccinia psidii MF-1 TaxID=1389203 RepID=A0A9Q3GHP3_9BASI|nr:hypothetical protein [Austropuccinia psidii MF-1]